MYEIGFLYKKWNLQRRSDCILGKCFCQKSLKNHNLFLHFLSMLGLFQIALLLTATSGFVVPTNSPLRRSNALNSQKEAPPVRTFPPRSMSYRDLYGSSTERCPRFNTRTPLFPPTPSPKSNNTRYKSPYNPLLLLLLRRRRP